MTSAVQEWQLDFERAREELNSLRGPGEAWQVGLQVAILRRALFFQFLYCSGESRRLSRLQHGESTHAVNCNNSHTKHKQTKPVDG